MLFLIVGGAESSQTNHRRHAHPDGRRLYYIPVPSLLARIDTKEMVDRRHVDIGLYGMSSLLTCEDANYSHLTR